MFVAGTHRAHQEYAARGYVWLQRPVQFGAAAAARPAQSNDSQTFPESPFDRVGYQSIDGPVQLGAAAASQPLQDNVAITYEERRDYAGFQFIRGPVQFGAVAAIRPLQDNSSVTIQEFPLDRIGYQSISAPFIITIAPTVLPAGVFVAQEFPADRIGYQAIDGPVQLGAVAAVQPLADNLGVYVPPESPFDRVGYQSIDGPVQIGAIAAIRPRQSTSVVTREERRDLTGFQAVAGPVQFGPVAAIQPFPSGVATRLEWPWHPTPWASAPAAFVLPPSYIISSISTRLEWPWHPGPWTSPPLFGVAPAVPAFPQKPTIVLQEFPADRIGYQSIDGPVQLGPVAAVRPLQSSGVVTVEERRDFTGYRQIAGPVAFGAAQAAKPLQASGVVTREEQRNFTGFQLANAPVQLGAVAAVQPPASSIAVRLEWPGFHPAPWIESPPLPVGLPVSYQISSISTRQELPAHPGPWAKGPVQFGAAAAVRPFSTVVTTRLEWPGFHPTSRMGWALSFTARVVAFPFAGTGVTTGVEWPRSAWQGLQLVGGPTSFVAPTILPVPSAPNTAPAWFVGAHPVRYIYLRGYTKGDP